MYTAQEIKNRLSTSPFVPVRFVTSSGEKYDVYHPDLVLVGIRDIFIGFSSAMDPKVYDGSTRLALMHITALEDLPPKTAKSKKNSKV